MALRCRSNLGRQAGADNELRTCIDGTRQIVTIQHGSGADMSAFYFRHLANGLERTFCAQGHFKRGQPARDQRLRDRARQ